jgi:hypothetical protein
LLEHIFSCKCPSTSSAIKSASSYAIAVWLFS